VNLSEVWDYFNPEVQQVFSSLALEYDRIRTKSLLGGLSKLPNNEAAEILEDIEREAGVDLILPEQMITEVGECPDDLTFSPCVKETLNFFRVHQLRPVTVANLALRLLQIGTGSTVMELEESGHLRDIRSRLEAITAH